MLPLRPITMDTSSAVAVPSTLAVAAMAMTRERLRGMDSFLSAVPLDLHQGNAVAGGGDGKSSELSKGPRNKTSQEEARAQKRVPHLTCRPRDPPGEDDT